MSTFSNCGTGTQEALRIGLEAMRKERDDLDRRIRECESFMKAPTKAMPVLTAIVTPIVRKVKKTSKRNTPPVMTTDNILSYLKVSTGRTLARGEMVKALIGAGNEWRSLEDLANATKRTRGMMGYAVRTAPRGLFCLNRTSNGLLVRLSDTGYNLCHEVFRPAVS